MISALRVCKEIYKKDKKETTRMIWTTRMMNFDDI
jgi:hypothetical protein